MVNQMDSDHKEEIPRAKRFAWQGMTSPEQLTDEIAWQIFRRARWKGDKPKCIYCGHNEIRRLEHRGLVYCLQCQKKFTERKGTTYYKSKIPMKKIIFFAVMTREGIPASQLYKVLVIPKTAALRLSKIVKTCALTEEIVKYIKEETTITAAKIIYSLNPDFDSTIKYKKKFHVSLQLAKHNWQRCNCCGSFDVDILELNYNRTLKCRQCETMTPIATAADHSQSNYNGKKK